MNDETRRAGDLSPSPAAGSEVLEALMQCRSELASLHHGDCDMEHAEKHSAGLRMANAALDRQTGEREGDVAVDVQAMRCTNGTDYYVRITCGGRSTTPFVFKERFKAEYEAAHFRWIFGSRLNEPKIMAFDEQSHPNDPLPAAPRDADRAAGQGERA